jgi:hypothetical protein
MRGSHANRPPGFWRDSPGRSHGEIGRQSVASRFALFSVKIDDVSYLGYDPETHRQHFAQWPSSKRARGTGLDGSQRCSARAGVDRIDDRSGTTWRWNRQSAAEPGLSIPVFCGGDGLRFGCWAGQRRRTWCKRRPVVQSFRPRAGRLLRRRAICVPGAVVGLLAVAVVVGTVVVVGPADLAAT